MGIIGLHTRYHGYFSLPLFLFLFFNQSMVPQYCDGRMDMGLTMITYGWRRHGSDL